MKSTGMVRKVDQLGRVVIPRELRRTLDMNEQDPLEIFVDHDKVILQKYKVQTACAVTGEITDDNQEFAEGIWLSRTGMQILYDELAKTQAPN